MEVQYTATSKRSGIAYATGASADWRGKLEMVERWSRALKDRGSLSAYFARLSHLNLKYTAGTVYRKLVAPYTPTDPITVRSTCLNVHEAAL